MLGKPVVKALQETKSKEQPAVNGVDWSAPAFTFPVQSGEVERYLTEDALKLEAFVRAGERETLKLEGRQA